MSLFSSARERNLWLLSLIVLATIYSTLGIVRPFSSFLRDKGLLEISFIVSFSLVGIIILVINFIRGSNGIVLGGLLGIFMVYLMILVRIEIPEERTHIIEYGVFAVLVHQALLERKRHQQGIHSTLLAFLIATMAGILDEVAQAFIPGRIFDIRDILFNTLAGCMAIGSSLLLTFIRRKTLRTR